MRSFNNVFDTNKQDLSHIIKELVSTNSIDLIRASSSPPTTSPRWMQWLFFQHSYFYSIEELLYEYSELEKRDTFITASQRLGLFNNEEKAKLQYALELGKLAIKIAVLNSLPKIDKAPTAPPDDPDTFKKSFKKILYGILFLIGTVIAILQGIDGVNSLLQILGLSASIAAWPVVICSILGAVCACALYYAFELEFLKEKLGLTNNVKLQSTLSIHEKQIDTATQIEKNLLITAEKIHNAEEFSRYVTLCQKFNTQITSINTTIHCYQESGARKIARYCIMKAGIILAIGDTLYTVIGVIGGVGLSSNPVSIVCYTLLAIGAAAFFIASYTDQIYEKINSAARQMNSTKEKAENYCDHHLLDSLQEKLIAKRQMKKSREDTLALQKQVTAQSQQLAKQEIKAQQQKKELELWQMWRSATHDTKVASDKKGATTLSRKRSTSSLLSITGDPDTAACKPILSRRKSSF